MRGSSPTGPSVTLTTWSHRAASFKKDAAVTTKEELLSNSARNPTQLPHHAEVLTPTLFMDQFYL